MPEPWEVLKLLADPTRLRLLCLLRQEELSVAEIQEILDMGQSRISTHLGLLRSGNLLLDRKDGKRSYYSLVPNLRGGAGALVETACASVEESSEVRADLENLKRILEQRRRIAERYFNEVAGRLERQYCPGRSWEALGHLALRLIPHVDIVDLGAGEGVLSILLARRARSVQCIDNSPKMVEFGQRLAQEEGIENMTYLLGDIEKVPLADASVDIAILSQALHHARHPQRALAEAHRILRRGGRLMVLDLREHTFEKARELYADVWLGFSENFLYTNMRDVGFQSVEITPVAIEQHEPGFVTLLAEGLKDRS
jgi:ubiquinone/menaquinone biosynthesis C-methylase UbiE